MSQFYTIDSKWKGNIFITSFPCRSWLLSEHPMFVRTSFDKYEERVNLFFKEVLSRVKDLQFYTSNGSKGGPIIAVQVGLPQNTIEY